MIILILALFSFMNFHHDLPEDERLAYEMMNHFTANVNIHGLHHIGSGLAEDKSNNKISLMNISFSYDNALTIDLSRKIIVQLTQKFINCVNADQQLLPYLSTIPITPKQVRVSICGLTDHSHDSSHIHSVVADAGYILYCTSNVTSPHFGILLKETYEEALRNLKTP